MNLNEYQHFLQTQYFFNPSISWQNKQISGSTTFKRFAIDLLIKLKIPPGSTIHFLKLRLTTVIGAEIKIEE